MAGRGANPHPPPPFFNSTSSAGIGGGGGAGGAGGVGVGVGVGGGGPQFPLSDPNTMRLTDQEIETAQIIKAAVELDERLEPLSDYEYVQHALTHGMDPDNKSLPIVLEHISRMQSFRELYNIRDDVQEGAACIDAMTSQHPGLFLTIHYMASVGNCIGVNDWAAFIPTQINTPNQHAIFMKGFYYRFQSMNPTFLAMKLGMSNLVECDGATWENLDMKLQEQVAAELYMSYPTRHKETYFVNSPTVVNCAYGLWKKFMTQNMKDTFHLGYQVDGMEGRRIDELFKIPTPEIARLHMVANTRQLLRIRYHHQATFQLPPIADIAC